MVAVLDNNHSDETATARVAATGIIGNFYQ